MSKELIFMDTDARRLVDRVNEFKDTHNVLWASSEISEEYCMPRYFIKVGYDELED